MGPGSLFPGWCVNAGNYAFRTCSYPWLGVLGYALRACPRLCIMGHKNSLAVGHLVRKLDRILAKLARTLDRDGNSMLTVNLVLLTTSFLFLCAPGAAASAHVSDRLFASSTSCTATLSGDLNLHIPIVNFNDNQAYYWADFAYVPNTMDFTLTNGGPVSDVTHFSSCAPSTLSTDFKLHIPAVTFGSASYWADLQYTRDLIFTLTGAGQNRANFGVTGGLPLFTNEIKEAGAQFQRINIVWSEIEPQRDQYDWARMDDLVQTAEDAGIELLGCFASTPLWAQKNRSCNLRYGVCAINDMDEFKDIARRVADRYKGKITHLEILNEVTLPEFFEQDPTNRYEDWLIAGYEGVKQGNPDAKVLVGGFVNPLDQKDFVDRMLRDYSGYYDIVNFHVYATEDVVTEASRYIAGRMQTFSVIKPIGITETASKASTEPDLQKMARDVVKRHTRAFGQGIEKVFWWQLVHFPLAAEYAGAGTATWTTGLGWDYPKSSGQTPQFHPRQAFITYKLMTLKLDGFSGVTALTDTHYRFLVNGTYVYVLWGPGTLPPELTGRLKVTDYLGNEEIRLPGEIVLTENPIFVETVR